jgi:DNA-binding MarR family transcriptional regulator
MWEVFKASRPYVEATMAEFDLTPLQAYALKHLSTEEPLAMNALADAMACDASNVTWIADRLEERGLVERRSLPHDRRVKALVVTPAGLALQKRVHARMEEPPPPIANLTRAEQRTLRDILDHALDALEETKQD